MKKLFVILLLPLTVQAQTLEECQQAAERNYPLISQYDLVNATADLTVSNIQKGWLPQVSAMAQATLQSDVASWPDQIKGVYSSMGIDMKGLRKDQYKVGVDVQQMVYDGGMIRSQKEVARQASAVEEAQTAITMYQVRRRVNEMYFGLLLLNEQIRMNNDLQELLNGNEQKLYSMFQHGTAAESDYLAVKAERLGVCQQAKNLQAQKGALQRMLSVLCGIEVKQVVKPVPSAAVIQQQTEQRPELRAIEAQLKLADVQEKSLDAALMPKLSVFASGFYGYPGYNMFEDMMNHKWSLNGLVGARVTWNIGALYTRKNDKAKIDMQRSMINVQRETFLFNNNLEQIQQNENIKRYRSQMKDDDEIISLRSRVRKAAESKLSHGIIDVNDLLKEISAENNARVQQSVHEIEMLKEMYDLKFTTNN